MNKNTILAMSVLLLAVSCKKNVEPAKQVPLITTKNLSIIFGEEKKITESGVFRAFDSVMNDSRCPEEVECVWSGNAEAKFFYKQNDKRFVFSLNTNQPFRSDTLIDGLRIKLLKLNPYPKHINLINQKDYKAELEIVKD